MKKILTIAIFLLALTSCNLIVVDIKPTRITLSENLTYEENYDLVAAALKAGKTELKLELPAEPSDEIFKAIRRALLETEEVADGSIKMTLWGAEVIGENAFGYHADLTNEWVNELSSVSLPDAIEIKNDAFYGCHELQTFSAPKAKTLGRTVLVGCRELTHIELPMAEIIGRGSLHNLSSLIKINLPELKVLSSSMFALCENLETVILPKVTRIEERVFEENRSLKTIVFGSPIESIDGELFYSHDESHPFLTERIDLTLSRRQRTMINDSYGEPSPYEGRWYAAGEPFNFNSNEFAGYRFKSISPYE